MRSEHQFSRIGMCWRLAGAAVLAAAIASPADAQSEAPTLFIVNNTTASVASFIINDDGALTFVDTFSTGEGPQALDVSPNGRYLAVGHGTASTTTEELRIFEIGADASLTEVLNADVPDSPLSLLWLDDQKLAVAETDLGESFVNTFAFDADAPALTQIDSEATGDFTPFIALRPQGDFLYADDSFGNFIFPFNVEDDGSLTPTPAESTGSLFALEMAISDDGAKLYAAAGISGDGQSVLGFSIDDQSGELSPLPGSPFTSPGSSPAHIVLSEDDQWAFVGHGSDATIWSFAIEDDGALTPTGEMFDVGFQGSIGDLAIMDDILFVSDETSAFDNQTGVYTFQIDETDGSFSIIGMFSTQGGRPQAIALWNPAGPAADLNGDGVVDGADLGLLLGQWGADGPADLNDDGVVDGADLGLLLGAWG